MSGTTTSKQPLVAALLLAALLSVACSSGGGGNGLSGVVEGDGSSTVGPITEAIAEEFLREEPGVQVPNGTSGTGGGFEKFCNGETDFNNASRPIKDEERTACANNDVEFEEFQVAIDGLTVIVHPDNDWADCLTVAELSTIWGPEAEGKIKNWSQVRDGFPDVPLELFGPGSDSGTFDYFTDEINGEEGAQRTDYGNIGEDDNQALRGVQNNEGGMAYFGFAFYINNTGTVKDVAIDSGDGCVEPSTETVENGTYAPLSRPLFVYVRTDALQRPEVQAFFEFYFDTVNQIIADVGYVAMPQDVLDQQVAKLQALTG